jgi:hypothetical protein
VNTKEHWTTKVTIKDPARRALWIDVFPDAKLPIKNIIPSMANIDGEQRLVYWLDVDVLARGQIDDIVSTISKRFDLDPVQVRMDMQHGVPILASNTIAESTSMRALPEIDPIHIDEWEEELP